MKVTTEYTAQCRCCGVPYTTSAAWKVANGDYMCDQCRSDFRRAVYDKRRANMPPRPSPEQRALEVIQQRIAVDKERGCWLWAGTRDQKGYGKLSFKGRFQFAHRVSWSLVNGSIPEGMNVCHRCDVPSCVNPDHLFLGSQADNVADMRQKGRARGGSMKGERNPDARLSTEQVLAIRTDTRACHVVGAEHGVSKTTVSSIRTGKTWRHVA